MKKISLALMTGIIAGSLTAGLAMAAEKTMTKTADKKMEKPMDIKPEKAGSMKESKDAKSEMTEAPAYDLKKAAEMYKAKCASCHGADGKGKEPMAKVFKVDMGALSVVDAETLDKSDEELFNATKKGVGKMPAYDGKIADEDIHALNAYIRSLAKP